MKIINVAYLSFAIAQTTFAQQTTTPPTEAEIARNMDEVHQSLFGRQNTDIIEPEEMQNSFEDRRLNMQAELKEQSCYMNMTAPYGIIQTKEVWGEPIDKAITIHARYLGYKIATWTAEAVYAGTDVEWISQYLYDTCMDEVHLFDPSQPHW